jgi:hypothetical protein
MSGGCRVGAAEVPRRCRGGAGEVPGRCRQAWKIFGLGRPRWEAAAKRSQHLPLFLPPRVYARVRPSAPLSLPLISQARFCPVGRARDSRIASRRRCSQPPQD